jgi:hypothetical protein
MSWSRRSTPPATGKPSCWGGLLVRLHELTDLAHDIMALRRQIRAEEPRLANLTFGRGGAILTLKHRDHVMAFRHWPQFSLLG